NAADPTSALRAAAAPKDARQRLAILKTPPGRASKRPSAMRKTAPSLAAKAGSVHDGRSELPCRVDNAPAGRRFQDARPGRGHSRSAAIDWTSPQCPPLAM